VSVTTPPVLIVAALIETAGLIYRLAARIEAQRERR
jgi:hypothetical protein